MDEIGAIPHEFLGKKNQNTPVGVTAEGFWQYLKAKEEDLKHVVPIFSVLKTLDWDS